MLSGSENMLATTMGIVNWGWEPWVNGLTVIKATRDKHLIHHK